MGRLDHLKRTLPMLAQQPVCEVVVVDYSCPQNTADWVEAPAQSWPNVRAVRYPGQKFFNLSRARNIGAKHCRTKYIAFIDADLILCGNKEEGNWFTENVSVALGEQYFIRFNKWQCGHSGFLLCWYPAFVYSGGYPAKTEGWGYAGPDIEGYGWEDGYMRIALRKIGLQDRPISIELAQHLDHDQVSRVAHYSERDKDIGETHPRNCELARAYLEKFNPWPMFGGR
jgi:glycosyltransferase involved in cell wall biosynthesis